MSQGFQGIFSIKWPISFKELLSVFTIVNFDFIAIVPLECTSNPLLTRDVADFDTRRSSTPTGS